jgi:hypothetical protein
VKRNSRIDAALRDPRALELMALVKHLFAVATGVDHVNDRDAHWRASEAAGRVGWQIVDFIQAWPGMASLRRQPLYHYVLNRAFEELTEPIASNEDRREVELAVYFRAGRPPGARPKARQLLIDEIRDRPDMPDWRIADRAALLGVWAPDQADDRANVKRRIRRLRLDATK